MSAAPVLYCGARPVFIDCAPAERLDHRDLAAKITPRTRAVMPVYLWGRCGPARLATSPPSTG